MNFWSKLLYYVGIRDDGPDGLAFEEESLPPARGERSYERPPERPQAPASRPTFPAEPSYAPTPVPRHSGVTVLDGRTPPRTAPSGSTPPTPPRGTPAVRTSAQGAEDVMVVRAQSYRGDAKRVGDAIRSRRIVAVNMMGTTADERRRVTDFAAGTIYMIGGTMERLHPEVILIQPGHVKASPEAIERLRRSNFQADTGF